jgi:hypothetical protein
MAGRCCEQHKRGNLGDSAGFSGERRSRSSSGVVRDSELAAEMMLEKDMDTRGRPLKIGVVSAVIRR